MPWMHFEVYLEHDNSEEDRENIMALADTIFEFTHQGCKDLELHDPHVSMNFMADEPDWATNAATNQDR